MDEKDFKDHVVKHHEVQKPDREQVEKTYQEMKVAQEDNKKATKVQAGKEARAEQQAMDDIAKITKVLVDLIISGAMHEVDKQASFSTKSNATKDDEVVPTCQPKPASK